MRVIALFCLLCLPVMKLKHFLAQLNGQEKDERDLNFGKNTLIVMVMIFRWVIRRVPPSLFMTFSLCVSFCY